MHGIKVNKLTLTAEIILVVDLLNIKNSENKK